MNNKPWLTDERGEPYFIRQGEDGVTETHEQRAKDVKQERLDRFAVAVAGDVVIYMGVNATHPAVAREIWDIAETIETERERRYGGEK